MGQLQDDVKASQAATRDGLRQRLRSSEEYRKQLATSALVEGFSNQVAILRRQRGLKQDELARLARTSQPSISKIENAHLAGGVPNWEIDTLNRVAQALGCRLKLSLETYGSLVAELDETSSETLRRPDLENDPTLNPLPASMPQPDTNAPERTRWMQERMIPWLFDDTDPAVQTTLKRWLQGYGLPPVGDDESASEWLLRGIPSKIPFIVRDRFERRFAERLRMLLDDQPDLYPAVEHRPEEYLVALYSTCAGLKRPAYLAEPLWNTYKRLNRSRLDPEVRRALREALISNQPGDKAVNEIWKPMSETGKHRWLPGNQSIGLRGIAASRLDARSKEQLVARTLEAISNGLDGTPAEVRAFDKLVHDLPDRRPLYSAIWDGTISLKDWTRSVLPRTESSHDDSDLVIIKGTETERETYRLKIDASGPAHFSIATPAGISWQGKLEDLVGRPSSRRVLFNSLATEMSNLQENPHIREKLPPGARAVRDFFFVAAVNGELVP